MKAVTSISVFVIVILMLFLGIKVIPFDKNSISTSFYNQENNFNKESGGKFEIQTPLQWIESAQEEFLPTVEQAQKGKIENPPFQKIVDEFNLGEFGNFGSLNFNTTETAEKTKELEKYSIQVLGAWNKGFTGEEFKSIKKNQDGRALSLEELIQEAGRNGMSEELKISFKAWQGLDERVLGDLQKLSVGSQFASAHQAMLSWFRYHSEIAGKLSRENLSQGEINELFSQYSEKAKTDPPKFQQALSLPRKSFSLISIPKAQAQTEGSFYHFGGLVVSYADFCTNGFAVVISGVKGGLLWIYYPVYVANPFLYKIIAPGYYDLGRAVWGPGVCSKIYYNYPIGIAQILFFGSSAVPI